MTCKECERRPVCTEICDEVKKSLPRLRRDDAVDAADGSVEELAEETLKMQETLDRLVELENLGIRLVDEETGLPPCKLDRLYRKRGLV